MGFLRDGGSRRCRRTAAGALSAEIAAASALVGRDESTLLPGAPASGSWSSECLVDPLTVSTSDKGDLLVRATLTMAEQGADLAEATCRAWDTEKWFVSSQGSRISQHIVECGAYMEATVVGDGETQRRSYPGVLGQFGTHGWELVDELDLPDNAARLADEAQALVMAPLCPAGTTDLVLASDQMALQIHESVGHAVELDRILGWEAAFAGTSWLDLRRLGDLRFGSDIMDIVADATIPARVRVVRL